MVACQRKWRRKKMPRGMTVEERSFINLVNFFKPELQRIIEGEIASDVMPERTTRRTLRKHGVLTGRTPRKKNGTVAGTLTMVTEEAKKVLEGD
jgi:hypothetical protein